MWFPSNEIVIFPYLLAHENILIQYEYKNEYKRL